MLYLAPALFCLAGLVSSVPTALESRDVSSSVLQQLNLWGQYAAAAYCVENNNSPGTQVSCGAGNCPLVETASATTSIEFQNSLITDVTGFVAVDSTNRKIVVSFRGSGSVRNWLANVNFAVIPTTLCDGCTVHQGFWRSWLEARPGILRAVEAAASRNPGYGIVTTGHSLGGALATLCAPDLRNRGYSVALYTYGSPQVGKQRFADYVSGQPGGNYRITHTNDLVPKLPGIFLGYRHVGPEYWITSGTNEPVGTNDITVIPGQPLIRGNQATLLGSTSAHAWYFNRIAACSPDGIEFKQ